MEPRPAPALEQRVEHGFRFAKPCAELRPVRGAAVLQQHLRHADQAGKAPFRKHSLPLRLLQQVDIVQQHDIAEELPIDVQQRELQEPFPAVARPAFQQLLEILRGGW